MLSNGAERNRYFLNIQNNQKLISRILWNLPPTHFTFVWSSHWSFIIQCPVPISWDIDGMGRECCAEMTAFALVPNYWVSKHTGGTFVHFIQAVKSQEVKLTQFQLHKRDVGWRLGVLYKAFKNLNFKNKGEGRKEKVCEWIAEEVRVTVLISSTHYTFCLGKRFLVGTMGKCSISIIL